MNSVIKKEVAVKENSSCNGCNAGIVEVERVRRITGYLTGTVNRWGSSKQSELKDRVKHV